MIILLVVNTLTFFIRFITIPKMHHAVATIFLYTRSRLSVVIHYLYSATTESRIFLFGHTHGRKFCSVQLVLKLETVVALGLEELGSGFCLSLRLSFGLIFLRWSHTLDVGSIVKFYQYKLIRMAITCYSKLTG